MSVQLHMVETIQNASMIGTIRPLLHVVVWWIQVEWCSRSASLGQHKHRHLSSHPRAQISQAVQMQKKTHTSSLNR